MRTIPAGMAAERGGVEGVATLLARWRAHHAPDDFTALVAVVREPLVRMAARMLRRGGICDPGACDDVVALVLEQLFRLGMNGARPPPAFDRGRVDLAAADDPGWVYVRCIARSRARDVARAVRRRERLAAGYATSGASHRHASIDEHAANATDVERLHESIAGLDERSRELVTLLLDGKSQAVIAHVLGVCEGTVSRIRTRAIARLRAALLPKKRGGGGVLIEDLGAAAVDEHPLLEDQPHGAGERSLLAGRIARPPAIVPRPSCPPKCPPESAQRSPDESQARLGTA